MDKLEALKHYFGYDSYRCGQGEIIDAIFDPSIKGVLAVLPTGSGKSIIYQIAALLSKNITIVVSPLISLMKDQVDSMKKRGISAEFYNSSLKEEEKRDIIDKLRNKQIKILYVAPERFEDANFMEILKENKISVFAIDESHCISSYGHNFRPAYRKIRKAIFELKPGQVVGLTATATKKVQQDICNQLGAPNAKKFIMGFFRSDLKIDIVRCFSDRFEKVVDDVLCYHEDGIKTGIVYVGKRKDAETIVSILKNEHEINAMFYHAGMDDEDRIEIQNKWFKEGGVIVCTTAMGMGIDKRDVRFILHAYVPSSIEDYYQQIGRASRDGLGADCRMFVDLYEDTRFLNWMIDASYPKPEIVEKFWKYVNNFSKNNDGIITQTQEEMARSAGINPQFVGGCVGVLKKNSLIQMVEKGKYEVNYFDNYLQAPLDFEALRQLRKSQQDKMLEIIDFIEDKKTCRMVKILNYFDEKDSTPCGHCDICRKEKK
jgi:ATP-dependent DNA helicase RecQ